MFGMIQLHFVSNIPGAIGLIGEQTKTIFEGWVSAGFSCSGGLMLIGRVSFQGHF
jgi:hypothetical protein